MVELLLSKGVDVNCKDGSGRTALLLATSLPSYCADKVFELLLSQEGIDVNCSDNRGSTPLLEAARSGCSRYVKTLLDRGADPKHQNLDGHTALFLAVKAEGIECTRLLLDHPATDPHIKDPISGMMPVERAVVDGYAPLVSIFLTRPDIDPDVRNCETGESLLSTAALYGKTSVVELL
jgi:ankyrin repeat protein